MLFVAVLKRIVPFFITFAAGLFIASFFVSLASPSFNFPRRSYKYRQMNRLRDENRELRRANEALRRQLEEVQMRKEFMGVVDPSNFPPPPPPPPFKAVHPRGDR